REGRPGPVLDGAAAALGLVVLELRLGDDGGPAEVHDGPAVLAGGVAGEAAVAPDVERAGVVDGPATVSPVVGTGRLVAGEGAPRHGQVTAVGDRAAARGRVDREGAARHRRLPEVGDAAAVGRADGGGVVVGELGSGHVRRPVVQDAAAGESPRVALELRA